LGQLILSVFVALRFARVSLIDPFQWNNLAVDDSNNVSQTPGNATSNWLVSKAVVLTLQQQMLPLLPDPAQPISGNTTSDDSRPPVHWRGRRAAGALLISDEGNRVTNVHRQGV